LYWGLRTAEDVFFAKDWLEEGTQIFTFFINDVIVNISDQWHWEESGWLYEAILAD